MTDSNLKIYPSSAGFMNGHGVIVEYNSGCPRYVAIGKNQISSKLDPIYGQLGEFHENWYAEELGKSLKEREVQVRFEIAPEILYSGRCDFIVDNMELGIRIDETKASMSKSFLYDVIRKGKFKLGHLAQLVSYMIAFKTSHGQIVCGYYEPKKSPLGSIYFEQKELRIFKVMITEFGSVIVDGLDTGHTVHDQYSHTLLLAEVMKTGQIKDRPINSIEFMGPCRNCSLKTLCDQYDNKTITSKELHLRGVKAIKNQETKTYKWQESKKGRKK